MTATSHAVEAYLLELPKKNVNNFAEITLVSNRSSGTPASIYKVPRTIAFSRAQRKLRRVAVPVSCMRAMAQKLVQERKTGRRRRLHAAFLMGETLLLPSPEAGKAAARVRLMTLLAALAPKAMRAPRARVCSAKTAKNLSWVFHCESDCSYDIKRLL